MLQPLMSLIWAVGSFDTSLRMRVNLKFSFKSWLAPQENTLVQFRGDAMHGFDPFSSESGLPRVSLVVRSYKIATQDYAFTPEFHAPSAGA